MGNELAKLEPAAKMLAATGLSQSLSFCMERKYLERISECSGNVFKIDAFSPALKEEASWIEITQVGRPVEKSSESCFTAIQKILYSCFMPKETQLLFLIVGDETVNRMYLGVRSLNSEIKSKSIAKSLNEFAKGVWPGLESKPVNESVLEKFKSDVANDDKYSYIYALTGIPSMESQYKSVYPATIDKLMAGMNGSKGYAYLVVADPIEREAVEDMLYKCREMNGQAESLKSMNVTEGLSRGVTESISHTLGTSHQTSKSTSRTERKLNTVGKFVVANEFGVPGLALKAAASLSPAAQSVVESTLEKGTTAILGAIGLSSVVPCLVNQKTVTESESDSQSESNTQQRGASETNSQSISSNVVNKHIEAVGEKLFYHTQRLDTGKANGLWKVGVYLMASKKADIQSGAMQLRSILSGQESIYEPIRIHDITETLDNSDGEKTIRANSLARLNAPLLMVNGGDGRRFEHPLGDNYKELKSVLTTKELSYLVNFPLRSVPGISVIDSTPDFSLNSRSGNDTGTMSFGKLLYGGSETKIEYRIPLDQLSRHTLVTGVSGSGKTNTVQAILSNVSRCPFFVIEPSKTEYVDWALEYNRLHPDNQIDVYIPGCGTYKGGFKPKQLRLNPLEIVWLDGQHEPNVLMHIDRVKSVLAAAFPAYDILPVLMEDLLYAVYQQKPTAWLGSAPEFGVTMPPTLDDMSRCVDSVIEQRLCDGKARQNMMVCLNTRIDSLKRGWKGQVLGQAKSTPWTELFDRPCVVNLSYVGDDCDKSLLMSLLLQYLYEYRAAQVETGKAVSGSGKCGHVTVVEEAHRVMAKCENEDSPKHKSAVVLSNMLAEVRACGEGMLIVDQMPTRLVPEAIKNTNLKIAHRLVAEDDCKAVGDAMGLTGEQRKVIAKLGVGQCIVSESLSTDTYWVKAYKVEY